MAGCSARRARSSTTRTCCGCRAAGARLSKYEPDAYRRVRDRMVDIFLNGVAPEGSSWEPQPIAMSVLAEGPELARETFLLAATRLINRRGYRGASVDKISAELNVT